uniref:Ig-like domain-containing protein n=1 Tax=Prolemur simus TaxID=1328070 RepID=A0A8C8YSF3_PROSS
MLLLLLLLLLFRELCCPGESTVALGSHHPAAEEPLSSCMLQVSSFANHSWVHTQGPGWLRELQTHSWDGIVGTILSLWPWSRGDLNNKELKNFLVLLQLYLHGFAREFKPFVSEFQFDYPFKVHMSAGSDFLSFQGSSWVPSPAAGTRAQNVCKVLNHYQNIKEIMQSILGHKTKNLPCPRFLAALVAGKSDLERQGEGWVSSGPSPEPGHLLLVCHISGFYPKPVWVRWIRGEQEQSGTWHSDLLPNADGTCFLQATLDVVAVDAAGLSCRVKHSKVGDLDIIIHWDEKELGPAGKSWKTVLVLLLRSSSFPTAQTGTLSLPMFPALLFSWEPMNTRGSGHKLCLAQESWILKNFILNIKSLSVF